MSTMIDDDFDVMKIAHEELKFCQMLGITPIGWEFGVMAYRKLLLRFMVPASEISYGQNQALFFGLPLIVNDAVNQWTVKLIKPFPLNQPNELPF